MKLLIGIPTSGQPTRPFLDALTNLRLPPSITEADRLVWTGNFVAAQREMIARDALQREVDLLAMIDDDIVAPPDALVRLISSFDEDPRAAIAGALYYSRDGLRPMAVSRWNSTDTTSAAIPAYAGEGVAQVDGVGFGCVVIRLTALRELAAPYFAAHVYIDEAARTARQCDEDYLLCERVRHARWNVLLHAGVRAGHYDRGTDRVISGATEPDDVTDALRMIVRNGDTTKLVPFDDAVPRAQERQQSFPATLLFGS